MKLSEIEGRILALEKALASSQSCPADPCHIHHAVAEPEPELEPEPEPKHGVTQESWTTCSTQPQASVWLTPGNIRVCMSPPPNHTDDRKWPQRKVLIAHAPEMYRQLEAVCRTLAIAQNHPEHMRNISDLLTLIQKELQESYE